MVVAVHTVVVRAGGGTGGERCRFTWLILVVVQG